MTKSLKASALVGALLDAATGELADLDVRREGGVLTVDGERGDRLVVYTERRAAPAGTASFHTAVALCLLPYAAWTRREPLSAARGTPYREGDGVIWDRIAAPNGWPPGIWEVTETTLDKRRGEFVSTLRTALRDVWLPLLPRTALHAALRDSGTKLPGLPADRRIGELMCVIEDTAPADRDRLATFLQGRGDAELAAWVRTAL
ncbi:hypothetical protein ACQP00_21990 [Dactylosporangium sp. CS-047395]|uniref:hypothetical protein n=1 Tax=Dactylosporangium sp. CS-047395 TaxID=3239936 RepID=UPI003D916667